jgi:hypothetical protein
LRGRSISLAAASGSIPAQPGLRVEGRSFGKLPGGEAELLRRSQAAGLQWIGVPAAAGLGSKQRQGSGRD